MLPLPPPQTTSPFPLIMINSPIMIRDKTIILTVAREETTVSTLAWKRPWNFHPITRLHHPITRSRQGTIILHSLPEATLILFHLGIVAMRSRPGVISTLFPSVTIMGFRLRTALSRRGITSTTLWIAPYELPIIRTPFPTKSMIGIQWVTLSHSRTKTTLWIVPYEPPVTILPTTAVLIGIPPLKVWHEGNWERRSMKPNFSCATASHQTPFSFGRNTWMS